MLLNGCSLVYGASVSATQKQVKQLQADIRGLEQQLSSMQGQRSDLQQQLRDVELQSAKLNKKITGIRAQIQSAQKQLKTYAGERQRLLELKQAQQQQLHQQLLSAYRVGQQDQIKLLLNQEDPERVSRMMRYYGYITSVQVKVLKNYEQTLADLQQIESDIRQQQQSLETTEAQLQQQSDELKQVRASRAQTLAKLQSGIGKGEKQLSDLKANQSRLKAVIERLQQSLERADLAWQNKDFRQLKGQLKWPARGQLASGYGSVSRQGLRSDGIIIAAPSGRAVNAVHNGRVVFSDWLRGFGLLTIIDHGSGYMSLYGHNDTLLKEVGDWVTANEQIATVGDSGGSSESGLYFAIRYKGQAYNPQPWLAKK